MELWAQEGLTHGRTATEVPGGGGGGRQAESPESGVQVEPPWPATETLPHRGPRKAGAPVPAGSLSPGPALFLLLTHWGWGPVPGWLLFSQPENTGCGEDQRTGATPHPLYCSSGLRGSCCGVLNLDACLWYSLRPTSDGCPEHCGC